MKKTFFLLLISISLFNFASYAQYGMGMGTGSKVMVESGNLDFLQGQTAFKVEYVYDGMAVGKFKTEEEYVKTKVDEYNKKEAGKGDKWKASWINARKERFEPKFEELMNDVLAKQKVSVKQSTEAKYTLILKTTFTEPGYNIGIAKYPAFINVDYIIVETANPKVVVAKFYAQNILGAQAMGFDYDSGSRIAESYAKAGKMFAKYLLDGYKKKK